MSRGLESLMGNGLSMTAFCVSCCVLALRGDGLKRMVSCVRVLQLLSEPSGAFFLDIKGYSTVDGILAQ